MAMPVQKAVVMWVDDGGRSCEVSRIGVVKRRVWWVRVKRAKRIVVEVAGGGKGGLVVVVVVVVVGRAGCPWAWPSGSLELARVRKASHAVPAVDNAMPSATRWCFGRGIVIWNSTPAATTPWTNHSAAALSSFLSQDRLANVRLQQLLKPISR